MAVTILSESYGPRKPFVVCTAASTDELADYAGLWAEGSEATISTTKYVLDRTKGWVEEGSGGGGGGDDGVVVVHGEINQVDFLNAIANGDQEYIIRPDKTYEEMSEADVLIACLHFDISGNTEDVCFYSTGTPTAIGNKIFLETGAFGRETLLEMANVVDLEFYIRVDRDNNLQPILVLRCMKAGSFDKLIVTLTPTAQDLSGTMDKTPAEIRAAYDAGAKIRFAIPSMNAEVEPTQFLLPAANTITCGAQIQYDMSGQLVLILLANDSSASTYGTSIVPLTPMSMS